MATGNGRGCVAGDRGDSTNHGGVRSAGKGGTKVPGYTAVSPRWGGNVNR